MFERLGDRESFAVAVANLAAAELELGDPRAGADYRHALAAAREIESPDTTVMSLDGLAAAAVRARDLERAAFLIGAADTLTEDTGAHGNLWPFEEARRAKTEAALRNGLPPDVLRRERSRGAAATLDEVVAFALVAPEGVEASRIAPGD
jgi:hypothetical protein